MLETNILKNVSNVNRKKSTGGNARPNIHVHPRVKIIGKMAGSTSKNSSGSFCRKTHIIITTTKGCKKNGASSSHDVEGKLSSRAWPQYLATILAAMSCLSIGFVNGWSAFAISYFKSLPVNKHPYKGNVSLAGTMIFSDLIVGPTPMRGHNGFQATWLSTLVALGGMVGALPAGALVNRVGRKALLHVMTMPIIVSWSAILVNPCINNSLTGLYLSRLMAGYTMGVVSVVLSMYIEEISEVKRRGALGVYPHLLLTLGTLLALVSGHVLPFPLTILLPCAAPLFMVVLMTSVPESPIFLVQHGFLDEARQAIRFLRGSRIDVEQQLNVLRMRLATDDRHKAAPQSPDAETAQAQPPPPPARTLFSVCMDWLLLRHHRGTRVAILLVLYRQLSGVSAIAYFAVDMFHGAESATSGQLCGILIGIVEIVAILLSSMAVDKIGRRPLLFLSAIGMSMSHMGLAYFFKYVAHGHDPSSLWWVPILMISGFIVMYSLGFGPLPWVMMAELIPTKDKGWATGITGVINWAGMFCIMQLFTFFSGVVGYQFAFLFFSVTCFMASIFVSLCVPETKKKTIEEIQDILNWDLDEPQRE